MQGRTSLADRCGIGGARLPGLHLGRLIRARLVWRCEGQRRCQSQRGPGATVRKNRISQHLPRGIQQPAFEVLIALHRAQHRVVVLDRKPLLVDRLFGRGACAARQGLPSVSGALGFGLHRVFLLDTRDMAGSHADLGQISCGTVAGLV
jgi:hypothetical protein